MQWHNDLEKRVFSDSWMVPLLPDRDNLNYFHKLGVCQKDQQKVWGKVDELSLKGIQWKYGKKIFQMGFEQKQKTDQGSRDLF
jgi:hypothetical protein